MLTEKVVIALAGPPKRHVRSFASSLLQGQLPQDAISRRYRNCPTGDLVLLLLVDEILLFMVLNGRPSRLP